jgi:ParB family transcriptional regulator, chromosome partitioning protein
MESVEYREVPWEDLIVGPFNLRGENAQKSPSLKPLKDSIWEDGLLHLPGGIENDDGTVTLVYGHRRFWAIEQYLKEAFPTLPVRIIPKAQANELTAIRIAIAENVNRKSLNPIELAKKLLALRNAGFSNREIADEVGYASEGTVTDIIKLLSLEPDVQAGLMDGSLVMGHGKALLKLLRYPAHQLVALQQLAQLSKKERTVRTLEGIINALLAGQELARPGNQESLPPWEDTASEEADGGVVTCRYCEHQLTLTHLSDDIHQVNRYVQQHPKHQQELPGLFP